MSAIKGLRLFITAAIMGCGSVAMAQSLTVQATVDFGTPPTGGGACYGKGICSSRPLDGTQSSTVSSGTTTTFRISPNGKILSICFNLNELTQQQPNEAQLVVAGANTFTFDNEFSFSDQLFSPLNLPSGTSITPNTTNTVLIDENGNVTMMYRIAE